MNFRQGYINVRKKAKKRTNENERKKEGEKL